MAGNSPIRYAKVKRALTRGVAIEISINGSHHKWSYRGNAYSIPVHGGKVKMGYVVRLRRAWKLRPEDGVSDKDFWDGKWGA